METENQEPQAPLETEIEALWQRIRKPKDRALFKLLMLALGKRGESPESLLPEDLEAILTEPDPQPAKAKKEELPRALTEEELARFRAVISDELDSMTMESAIEGALRESEILCLEREDVLWDERIIRVRGKGETHREVHMTSLLHEAFEKAMRVRPVAATHNRVLWNRKDPSEMLRARQTLWKKVKKYARLAGISRRVTFHDLRHTALTRFYRKTGSLERTRILARHSKAETTANHYIHLTTDDIREDMEELDPRPRWVRWWNSLKPELGIPEFFKAKSSPLHIGDIVGRERELSEIRKVLRDGGQHCLLIGDPYVGRKTLLKAAYEEQKARPGRVYQSDGLKPAMNALQDLYNAMKEDGLPVGKLPSDTRATKVWTDAICEAAKDEHITIFIYDSDDPSVRELRDLGKACKIFTSTTPEAKQMEAVRKALFKCCEIEVAPFDDQDDSNELAEKSMSEKGITVPNRKEYLNHIFHQSGGNPRAILELIEETRATGQLEPEYLGGGKERSAAPIVYFILGTSAVLRYSARSTGHPEWTLFFVAVCLIAATIGLICRIYRD